MQGLETKKHFVSIFLFNFKRFSLSVCGVKLLRRPGYVYSKRLKAMNGLLIGKSS